MAYTAWSVSFGEQPSAAKWNILGTNDASFNNGTGIAVSAITPEKLLTGTGTSWAWTSYTPTWTASSVNPAIGNGTITGRYKQIGKTVFFKVVMQTGTTSTYGTGSYRFSLPVTSATVTSPEDIMPIGRGKADRLGTANMPFDVVMRTGVSTYVELFYISAVGASSAFTNIGNSSPYTWSTSDKFVFGGTYEAA